MLACRRLGLAALVATSFWSPGPLFSQQVGGSPQRWTDLSDPSPHHRVWEPIANFSVPIPRGVVVTPVPLTPFVAVERVQPNPEYRVYDLRSGRIVGHFSLTSPPSPPSARDWLSSQSGPRRQLTALSPDGRRGAWLEPDSVVVRSMADGRELVKLEAAQGTCHLVEFLDDERLATIHDRDLMKVWSIPDGQALKSFRLPRNLLWWRSSVVTPGGNRLIMASEGG
jgi:hypothetical protein